jgi:hypothetical protein
VRKLREFWIYKGSSNFCSDFEMQDDCETMAQARPDGFYDVVSLRDTIEGGIHVIEYEALEDMQRTEQVYRMNRIWIEDAKKRIEQLEAELANSPPPAANYIKLINKNLELANEVDKLQQANQVLRDGLEFYGNDGPGFICMCEEEVGDGPMSGWVQCDSGDNARTALEQADKIMEGDEG